MDDVPGMSVRAVRAARRAVDGGEAVHRRRHALAPPAPARAHSTPRSSCTHDIQVTYALSLN